jgi:methionyl-tRNA formyltransferase
MVDGARETSAGEPLRIVFFGTPEFAVPTLRELVRSRHAVVGVVTQPDRARGRGHKVGFSPIKTLALDHDLPLIQPDRLREPSVAAMLRNWQPDLGVVAAYGKLIPDALLAIPRLGMINVHGSLLPRLRGAAPVHRAVIAGDDETGITIMRVVKALDSGDMFATVKRPIAPDETSDVVERDLAQLGAALLVDIVDRIAAGTAVEEPQDSVLATYAPKITKEEGLIDWSLPASSIHNRVRGLYPWPHAYTYLNSARLIVLRTLVTEGATDALPGTVTAVNRDAIVVATGDGGQIALLTLQPEGRRPMEAREFLAGHPVQPGFRFSSSPGSLPATEA